MARAVGVDRSGDFIFCDAMDFSNVQLERWRHRRRICSGIGVYGWSLFLCNLLRVAGSAMRLEGYRQGH